MRIRLLSSRLIAVLVFGLLWLMQTNVVFANDKSPLCFTARNGKVTLQFEIKNVHHTIQYSTDTINWYDYASNTIVTLNANDKVFFRAESDQSVGSPAAFGAYNLDNCSRFYFSSTNGGTVEASGNIMSLYGPNCPNIYPRHYFFANMFRDCSNLVTAPELPSTVLTKGIYKEMFKGCTSLTAAPDINWNFTEGNNSCESMFEGCTSLTYVSDFKYGSFMHDSCFFRMFKNCSSLIITPDLTPINNVFPFSCAEMFKGCTSLIAISGFPDGEILNNGCKSMFNDCTSLTTVPNLSRAPIGRMGFAYMFKGCTSLTTIPELLSQSISDSCYFEMFKNCSNLHIDTTAPGKPWQIPESVTEKNCWNCNMFEGTGGTFTGNPEVGVTYYIDTVSTAVNDVRDDVDFILSPNPKNSDDIIYIKLADIDFEQSFIEIFNANGVLVKRFIPASSTITIDGLNEAGLYIVRITLSNGKTATRKLLVR